MHSTVIGVPTNQSLSLASVSLAVEFHTRSHSQLGSSPHASIRPSSVCAGRGVNAMDDERSRGAEQHVFAEVRCHAAHPAAVIGLTDSIERVSNSQPIRLGVVGTGYVGLTTGACFAHLGHHVICGDVDARKVDLLNAGQIPIVEDGLAHLVDEGRAAGRLEFVLGAEAAAADADIVFLCVPTPQGDDGSADLSYIEEAARQIAPVLKPGAVVVNKSTVPVGSTLVVERALQRDDVFVVSNPEFLREGTAVHDFLHPDRVVIGSADRSAAERVADLYASIDTADPDHRPCVGRDDQVRGERLPGDEDLLRQRGRGDVRSRRCRRRRGRRRHRIRRAYRAAVPATRVRAGAAAASRRIRGPS